MKFIQTNEIKIELNWGDEIVPVGRLAMRSEQIYFEYDQLLIERGHQLSPIRLPLQSGVKTFNKSLFDGLPGLFYDSLPDGWGRLLLDRLARSNGIHPNGLTPLDRLSHIGCNGIGALTFQPDYSKSGNSGDGFTLDELAQNSQIILSGEGEAILEELLDLNGSSAGARPKIMVGIDPSLKKIIYTGGELPVNFEAWMVKFANSQDGQDAGAIEYVYSLMAQDAGVTMMKTHLFDAKGCAGYFATKRFDRNQGHRLHTHTACGLLHSDFRTPALDYEDLLTLTEVLTKDAREVEKMFRYAVFNTLSHNRDDHGKNFTYLLSKSHQWTLSPAYDLTFSSGPQGEQSTTLLGEGKNPSVEHLIKLGKKALLSPQLISQIIDQTKESLRKWPHLAGQFNVSRPNIKLIEKKIIL